MKNKLHIVLTGERNAPKAFIMSKNMIKTALFSSLALLTVLIFLSAVGLKYTHENLQLKSSLASMQKELQSSKTWNQKFAAQLSTETQKKEVELKNSLKELMQKNDEKQIALNNALSELKSKSETIESILKTVGIKTKIQESSTNTGGPFSPLDDDSYEDLSFKVNYYLDIIQSVPLGTPVMGVITSKYGRRIDPINKQPAFHSGVDIRKEMGAEIASTADGIVVKKGYTKGHGNYVVIDHGNGFKTRYFHMKKSLVDKGDTIKRGQQIGLVGNSGRSTGAHLHYEILHHNKSVNPLRFIRIARYISNKKG